MLPPLDGMRISVVCTAVTLVLEGHVSWLHPSWPAECERADPTPCLGVMEELALAVCVGKMKGTLVLVKEVPKVPPNDAGYYCHCLACSLHTFIAGCREVDLGLGWKCPSCCLSFLVPEGAMQADGREKPLTEMA